MEHATRYAIRNAVATVAYIFLVGLFVQNAERLFGGQPNPILGATTFLLTFVISALVTSSLVLWKPAQLLIEGKKREAGLLLLKTGLALVVLLAILVGVLIAT